jgi:chromosome segregation ATPase
MARSNLEAQLSETAHALQSSKAEEAQLRSQIRELEQHSDDTMENISERERQYRVLAGRFDETSRSLQDATSREAVLRKERDAEALVRSDLMAARDEAMAELSHLRRTLEQTSTRLREVERQSADLEITNLEITKSQKRLEDDNAGLYMALEAKQQELTMVGFSFVR